jgi:arginine decarboxylase
MMLANAFGTVADPPSTTAPAAGGERWSVADSAELYGLSRWGDPYFSVSDRGHVMVQPRGDRGGSLDLVELVQELQGRDLSLPLLIRFDDILEDRLERIHGAFERAIAQYGYALHQ